MKTVILTKIYKVSVRVTNTGTILCEKYFFNSNQANNFSEMVEENNNNITALVLTEICEDSIIYTENEKI